MMKAVFSFIVFSLFSGLFVLQGVRFQRRYRRDISAVEPLDEQLTATRRIYLRAIVIAYTQALIALAAAFYVSF